MNAKRLIIISCLLFMASACSVNKRAHRPGYNVEWHSANPKPKKHAKIEDHERATKSDKHIRVEEEVNAGPTAELQSSEEFSSGGNVDENNTLAGGESSSGILEQVFKIGKSCLPSFQSDLNESGPSGELPQQRNSQADNLAIWGFVISLIGFWIPFAGPIAAVILSAIALSKMRDNPMEHRLQGLAIAGLILGILALLFWLTYLFLILIFMM